jgi:hypothetical protein
MPSSFRLKWANKGLVVGSDAYNHLADGPRAGQAVIGFAHRIKVAPLVIKQGLQRPCIHNLCQFGQLGGLECRVATLGGKGHGFHVGHPQVRLMPPI